MIYVICAELIINLILLNIYYMHMYQLNSYFVKKQMRWMKSNIKNVLVRFCLMAIAFETFKWPVATIAILALNILWNIPKKKSKIPLKYTPRVNRMFITEMLICVLVCSICGITKYIDFKLFGLCLISPCIAMIANFINTPIEAMIRQKYINQAKKILKDKSDLKIIGVTGSFGKTSVKNFLNTTLSSKYEVLITPLNYNTTMGVVKTIRENLKATHQIFVCEMGATKPNDIKEICDLVHPSMGIITAIGPQHMDSFKTIDNVIKTKYELADEVEKNNGEIFLNYNNEYIAKNDNKMKKVTYGIEDDSLDYNAYDIKSTSEGLFFKMKDKITDEEVEFKTKIIGKHNVVNLAGAIGIANKLGIPMKKMVPNVRELKNVNHRLELINRGNLTIIDDAYNANPVSSKSAIETLGEFEGTRVIVTPGLIELKDDAYKYNKEFGEYMIKGCDYIYVVGEYNAKAIIDGAEASGFDKEKIFRVSSPQEAMQEIAKLKVNGKITVLLENDLPDNYK